MLTPSAAAAAARGERGYTLIELLVAMLAGVLVTGILFTVLEFSTNQSRRLSDVAQANQLGNTTMTHVVDALHSACLRAGFTPIQEKSTSTKLIFVSGYSEEAEVPSVEGAKGGVRKEEIEWSEKEGRLWDKIYPGTGVNSKNEYTFAEKPTAKTLLGEDISQSVEPGSEKPEKHIEMFQYFTYAQKATKSTSEASSTLQEGKGKSLAAGGATLTAEQAANVASVLISFNNAPLDGKASLGRSTDFSSQVTFAFSAPNSEATIEAGPCE